MKRNLLIFSMLLAFIFAGALNVQAQSQKTVIKEEVSARGNNPDLKQTDICNMPDVERPDPTATRGSYCELTFDNYTGYYINVWVDGEYRGMLDPWGTGYVTVGSGWTTWYCETSGGTYFWQDKGSCNGEQWWNLK
ncbi:MAG: hypothetical protein C0592_06105 [Marinilabiliales bacterium]|nr:MAG: hypothetical protein C0592_06105 [Marinilabiliales bacterium]